jgi:cytochrome c1
MSVLLLAALSAGAQSPAPPPPIGERIHDLYDQRYQRTPAPAVPPAAPGGSPPAPPPRAPAQQTSPAPPPHHHHGPAPATGTSPPAAGAHDHGTPTGWKFTLPKGDADKGRAVFVKLECYACHEVKGQTFPGVKNAASLGPELSEMAAHHEPEFFAEAIVNPNALVDEPQWRAPDGTSKMPSFNDSLIVQELIDLVAFLKSLTPLQGTGHKH